MIKLGFDIYDEDKDGVISMKDLYSPFVAWSKQLYKQVFILDLSKMLALVRRTSLGIDKFAALFGNGYPAVVRDIGRRFLSHEFAEDAAAAESEPEKYEKLIAGARKLIKDATKADKIVKIFKRLAVNPEQSTMHLTKDSLEKGFVSCV